MTLGLIAAVCAFGTLVAPALAKKKEKPPVFFGKFIASFPNGKPIEAGSPAADKGHGELESLNLAKGALHVEHCSPLKSNGMVDSARSETFFQDVHFKHCLAIVQLNPGLKEELVIPPFTLAMEFHSNQSAEIGAGNENEVEILKPSTVTIPIGKKAPCRVTIPSQTIPTKAEAKPEHLFEAASYETEKEETGIKKFPAGFQEKLDIEMSFTKIESWVKPNEHCIYAGGEEGAFDSEEGTPAFGFVVYKKGSLAAELEEITIKNGDLGFETKEEVEAEEAKV
ncbi:MAG TPA: hypothetical protein VK272_10460 [Solirubrobacteraceae bacterium]|nr:hypothetical protein [Solirubrobacteraceae bacterium]